VRALSSYTIMPEVIPDFMNVSNRESTKYKIYDPEANASASTVATVDLTNKPETRTNLYEGKPFLWLIAITVKLKHQGQGLSKLLTELAMEHSRKKKAEGRVALDASLTHGSSSAVIHGKNGFKFTDNVSQKDKDLLEEALKSRRQFYPDSENPESAGNLKGEMFLPESTIKEILKPEPELELFKPRRKKMG
jgi:hypothetical protein